MVKRTVQAPSKANMRQRLRPPDKHRASISTPIRRQRNARQLPPTRINMARRRSRTDACG
jgi:hypothetical protein